MALSELTENELRQLIKGDTENGCCTVKSIAAVLDAGAHDWNLIVEVDSGKSLSTCRLIEKRRDIKGYKSLDKLVVRLRGMGVKELLIKLGDGS